MAGSLMGWILVGLVAGVAARLLWARQEPGGYVTTILIGIAGALLGGYLGRAFGHFGPREPADWVAAIGGALVLLVGYRAVIARRG